MPDTDWVICGTGADDATIGSTTWVSPENITADDASYASVSSFFQTTHYIKGSNFGLSVPNGQIIAGIEIRAQLHDTDVSVQATLTAATVEHPDDGFGDDLEALATALTTTPTNYDYGGATELFGKSWTVANVNSSDFAVAFSCLGSASPSTTPSCDAIWVKVYYHTAGSVGKGLVEGFLTTPRTLVR